MYIKTDANDSIIPAKQCLTRGQSFTCFSVLTEYKVFIIQSGRTTYVSALFTVVSHVERDTPLSLCVIHNGIHDIKHLHGSVHSMESGLAKLQVKSSIRRRLTTSVRIFASYLSAIRQKTAKLQTKF